MDEIEVNDRAPGWKPSEPLLVAVTPLADYCLLLEYQTGERKRFDVKPYLDVRLYERLKDEAYFNTARLEYDGWFVGWPKGEDLGPDDLYELSVPVA